MTDTENPVLDYFNMHENVGKMLSTRTIAKATGLRQKDVFYYILSDDTNFERVEPLEVGYGGRVTRTFRKVSKLNNNINGDRRFNGQKYHNVCLQHYPRYPNRLTIPVHRIKWNVSWPKYNPPRFTGESVINNSRNNSKGNKWADPEIIYQVLLPGEKWNDGSRKSYEGIYDFDKSGRPRNPCGRTGLSDRGSLGKWGPNHAADPIVTRYDPERPDILQVIAIQRRDTGEWALPGGMVDTDEHITDTVKREFTEETGNFTDETESNHFEELTNKLFKSGKCIYKGYVDDLRNTDNAWIETTAYHFHCDREIAKSLTLNAGDDAKNVKWLDVDNNLRLHANHNDWVKLAAAKM